MKKAIIVSAFPGTGKTYLANNTDARVLDADSSNWSWLESGIRNPEFPANYIKHVFEQMDNFEIILVSSHQEVREALKTKKIAFIPARPRWDDKENYIARYIARGDTDSFVKMMDENWNKFITSMNRWYASGILIVSPGKYLSDYLQSLLEKSI